jgi:hypothetical protein
MSSEGAGHITTTGMLKLFLNEVGGRVPRSVLSRFASTLNYLQTGKWMREHNFRPSLRVGSRTEVIRTLAEGIADEEVLYLEFGVWRGKSMQLWSELLRNPASRLHGFDSFEGLPEEWDARGVTGRPFSKGHFSTGGAVPQISDPRVHFFKGWFEETLPKYCFVPSPVLVLFLDADLYSPTIYVLNALLPHIMVGTFIYFDEFWDVQNEQRAFSEFLAQTGMKLKAVVADYGARNVAFERIG